MPPDPADLAAFLLLMSLCLGAGSVPLRSMITHYLSEVDSRTGKYSTLTDRIYLCLLLVS